jgi:hypothetical protein
MTGYQRGDFARQHLHKLMRRRRRIPCSISPQTGLASRFTLRRDNLETLESGGDRATDRKENDARVGGSFSQQWSSHRAAQHRCITNGRTMTDVRLFSDQSGALAGPPELEQHQPAGFAMTPTNGQANLVHLALPLIKE